MYEADELAIQSSDRNSNDLMLSNFKVIRKSYNQENKLQKSQVSSQSVDPSDEISYEEKMPFTPHMSTNQEGFSNQVWKRRSLMIIYYVTKFLMTILTKSERFKFNYLNQRLLNALNDPSVDFNYYIDHHILRRKYENLEQSAWSRLVQRSTLIRWCKQCASDFFAQTIRVVKPDEKLKVGWDVLIFITLLINLIYIPIKVSFELPREQSVYFMMDQLPSILYLVDVILTFNTAYYSHGVLVINRQQIMKHYFHSHFLQDALSCIPLFSQHTGVEYMDIMQLCRVHRISDIMTNLEDSFNLRTRFASLIDVTKLIFLFLFVCHLISCAWYFVSVQEINAGYTRTWIDQTDLHDKGWSSRYITSLYWSQITTLTIGYGDIVPQTDAERLFVICVGLISSLTFGFTISSIGNIFSQISEQKKQIRDKLSLVNYVLAERGIKKDLQVKVRKFFEYFFEMNQEKDKQGIELFKNLTKNLQREINIDIYKDYLKHSILSEFSEDFIEKACMVMHERSMIPEEIIVNQGEMVNQLIFIIKGEVFNYIDKRRKTIRGEFVDPFPQKELKQLKKGQSIAELAFFARNESTYTSKAIQFTRLAILNLDDFMDLLSQFPKDWQKYQQIKNQLRFGEQCCFVHCEYCARRHQYFNCPFLFYQPNICIMAKQNGKNQQNRKFMSRMPPLKTHKTLKELHNVQEQCVVFQVQENVIKDHDVDDVYLKRLGLFGRQSSRQYSKGKVARLPSTSQDHEDQIQSEEHASRMKYINLLSKADARPQTIVERIDRIERSSVQAGESGERTPPTPYLQSIPFSQTIPAWSTHMMKTISQDTVALIDSYDTYNQLELVKKEYQAIMQQQTDMDIDKMCDFEVYYPKSNPTYLVEQMRQQLMRSSVVMEHRIHKIFNQHKYKRRLGRASVLLNSKQLH